MNIRGKSHPAVALARGLIRVYQLTLSPLKYALFGPSCGCRFHPSCSCYAREALAAHGFFRGGWMALRRVLRCHPWHEGGHDPVPGLKSEAGEAIPAHFNSHTHSHG
ncbi:MAG: membrane protein insertion efficiency factor YidD [Verrucomicrobiota bacterium]